MGIAHSRTWFESHLTCENPCTHFCPGLEKFRACKVDRRCFSHQQVRLHLLLIGTSSTGTATITGCHTFLLPNRSSSPWGQATYLIPDLQEWAEEAAKIGKVPCYLQQETSTT
jgi:hypothetical protein